MVPFLTTLGAKANPLAAIGRECHAVFEVVIGKRLVAYLA